MLRFLLAALLVAVPLGAGSANAQAVVFKNFASFRNLVPGIDFFASSRKDVSPYEKPAAEAVARLKELMGEDLPKGAIFICSSLQQKDSIFEPRVLRSGYSWSITVVTPEVRMQEMMERMQAQMGDNVPAEMRDRMRKRPPEMMLANVEQQAAATLVLQIAHAVIQTSMDENIRFRSSRLDDMGKSPLPDWLDIGIAWYAAGAKANLEFLNQNMEQTFPIEDILSMSRPFVASSFDQGGGMPGMDGGGMPGMNGGGFPAGGFPGGGMPGMNGGGFPAGGFPGGGMPGMNGGGFPGGGFPGGGASGGQRASRGGGSGRSGSAGGGGMAQRTIPKDEQDRMLFDGQSSTFFYFLIEKAGVEKIREMIRTARDGAESREYIERPDVLGGDFAKIEEEWAAWVKTLKS
ncbi:MAG: hypothetical protein JXP48_02390 [Acidobacteria bacterium]|nr:hypothetical protein [Acidobacteriota bacterium]